MGSFLAQLNISLGKESIVFLNIRAADDPWAAFRCHLFNARLRLFKINSFLIMNVFHSEEFQADLQSLMHLRLKWITAGVGLWKMNTIKGFINVLDSQMRWPKYA